MTEQHLKSGEAIKKLTTLVEDVKTCMLATVHKDYSLFSRPMQTVHVDDDGSIWFFTNEFSEKAADLANDDTVYLMYSHPGKNTYVHVKGKGAIVDDKQKMEQLWSPMVKAWFPKGLEDPALTLLKVETEEASFWDGAANKFVVFFQIIKAVAKGEKYDDGEFGKLEIN